jgi:sulfatase maturation enzyme AslB (radical SAM superfamily)
LAFQRCSKEWRHVAEEALVHVKISGGEPTLMIAVIHHEILQLDCPVARKAHMKQRSFSDQALQE